MSRWTSCESKSRFTEHEANRVAARFGQRAYLCNRCGGWHCTKSPDREAYVHSPPETKAMRIGRARKAVAELERKGVDGPLLDEARARLGQLLRPR